MQAVVVSVYRGLSVERLRLEIPLPDVIRIAREKNMTEMTVKEIVPNQSCPSNRGRISVNYSILFYIDC